MSTLHEDLRRLARECQSLVSKYTRAPGVNGDRVADLLIQDTYRIGTAMLEALAAHPETPQAVCGAESIANRCTLPRGHGGVHVEKVGSLTVAFVAETPQPEGVGTGAGEGAPRQDTASAWVTRSVDCPEAPAQAHPLAAEPDTGDVEAHVAISALMAGKISGPEAVAAINARLIAHDAKVRREAKAEALREAARDLPIWEAGNEVIAYQWLSDRADRIARAEGER